MTLSPETIQKWQAMADLTLLKCKEMATCTPNYCGEIGYCCSNAYCDLAVELLHKAGVKIPDYPFNKNGPCTIPPHFRPLCTLHQCRINSIGCDPKDPQWTKAYFELRAELESSLESSQEQL